MTAMTSITTAIKLIRAQYPTIMIKRDSDWNCIKMTTEKNSRGQANYDKGPEIDLGHTKKDKDTAVTEMFEMADWMTVQL
jgi:hypothetical protein